MTTTRAAERLAWAAAGAAATLAALAGMAVAWGRAVERNEAYGTWQEQGGGRISGPGTRDGDVPAVLSRGGPVCGFDDRRPCDLPGCVLHEPREAARVNWHRETRQVGPPLRVEPYRPEGTT